MNIFSQVQKLVRALKVVKVAWGLAKPHVVAILDSLVEPEAPFDRPSKTADEYSRLIREKRKKRSEAFAALRDMLKGIDD